MKTVNILSAGVLTLLFAGCSNNLPEVVNFPFAEGNTMLPATEVMSVERTDSSTIVTLMTMYDYYDTDLELNARMYLTTGEDNKYPLKDFALNQEAEMVGANLKLKKGIPTEYKLIFPPVPEDAKSIDLVNISSSIHGAGSIWGIDLTGKRSPEELPTEIPAELFAYDAVNDTLPRLVTSKGTATVNVHMIAWRPWQSNKGDFYINTMADTQEHIPFNLNDKGEATVKIPLEGTALISAHLSTNTYASTYVDPDETLDIYLLPNNYSESQRRKRPSSVTNGKYRSIDAYSKECFDFYENADTLLIGKTNTDEYFAAMMKIYNDGIDSLKVRNFKPNVEKTARAWLDRNLMYQLVIPPMYYSEDFLERNGPYRTKADSISRFSPEQIAEVRSKIDFSNPMLELKTMGNPGYRSLFLKAKEFITQ